MTTEETITAIIGDVCELPDYTSPDDQPDLLQCRVHELKSILQRHLSARPEVPRIPEGWVLVPIEPTHEMVKAYKNAMRNHIAAARAAGTTDRWKADARGFTIKEREKAFARWTAMLGAVASVPSPLRQKP